MCVLVIPFSLHKFDCIIFIKVKKCMTAQILLAIWGEFQK